MAKLKQIYRKVDVCKGNVSQQVESPFLLEVVVEKKHNSECETTTEEIRHL